MLQSHGYGDARGSCAFTPVLMDFGSAGPLTVRLETRRQVLTVTEEAASNTTMPYRPPELFEGGARHGRTETLDYGRVDVWSLGCVLFGLMHGTSPFEMEFRTDDDEGYRQLKQYGLVRVVECTHLKILGDAPLPPWARGEGVDLGTDAAQGRNGKYPLKLYTFVRRMVCHDRSTRPDLRTVAKEFGELHMELLDERWLPYEEGRCDRASVRGDYDDFDSLIVSRDFV